MRLSTKKRLKIKHFRGVIMSQPPAFHVLIPAAGSGTRAGGDTPKQYQVIHGKTVLRHTIETFIGLPGLKSLRVIIDPHWINAYQDAVQGLDLAEPVIGGKSRKESVFNGLKDIVDILDEEIIVVHDAARPFVRAERILAAVEAARQNGAATLAASIYDTIVEADAYTRLDRNRLRSIQTPQAFQAGLLKKAHNQFEYNDDFTDDAGMVAAISHPVTLIEGDRLNFKITTADDMVRAEKLLAPAVETRTGLGFDIHRFSDKPAQAIRLGGVDVPYSHAIDAHSDGDVILHALTDALLGTIGDGDIGQLFPPSDPQWKDADSHIFVKEALSRVQKAGGRLIHADISVQAEAPKIGPHRERMIGMIGELLGLTPDRIGLKATTMEQLGEIGAGLGLAAQVVVSVEFLKN